MEYSSYEELLRDSDLSFTGRSESERLGNPKTPDDFRQLGNKQYVFKRYKEAWNSYTEGIKISPKDIDLLLNRAGVSLVLKLFNYVIMDAEAVLTIDPFNSKAIYRKAKAIAGVKKYDEAGVFLRNNIKTAKGNSEELKNLLVDIGNLYKQQRDGTYNIASLLTSKKPNQNHNFAEFFADSIKLVHIPGKGRGIIVTEPVEPGQILIASKAIGIVYPDKAHPYRSEVTEDPVCHLISEIEGRLKTEPDLEKELQKLYPGPAYGEDHWESKLDHAKLSAICYFNHFEVSEFVPVSRFAPSIIRNRPFCGLWVLPSLINHSCAESNVHYERFGNFLIVRAFRPIPKGSEILFTYVSPAESYEKRSKMFAAFSFVCKCTLCTFEEREKPSVRQERKRLMEYDNNVKTKLGEKYLLKIYNQLISLRPNAPHFNFNTIWILEDLAVAAKDKQGGVKSIKYLEKAYRITNGTAMARLSIGYASQIAKYYSAMRNHNATEQWLEKFGLAVEAIYGKGNGLKELLLEWPKEKEKEKVKPASTTHKH